MWDSPLLRLMILLVTGLALYSPVFDGEWVFDDERLVAGHDWLWRDWSGVSAELNSWGEILRDGPREGDEVRTGFRPIRFISYRIDVLVLKSAGIDQPNHPDAPIPFHIHNLLLHVLVAWSISGLIGRLFPWSRGGLHLVVALVYLVHPVQTEAVAWISGRRDVLFSLFYLCALLGIAGQPLRNLRGLKGWLRGFFLALLGAMAMATKEMAATLPLVMVMLAAIPSEDDSGAEFGEGSSSSNALSLRRALLAFPVWIPVSLVVWGMTLQLLLHHHPGEGTERWGGSAWATVWTSGRALVDYMLLIIAPWGLTVDYSHGAFPPSSGPFQPISSIFCMIALVVLSVITWRYRGSAWSVLGWPLFFVLLSPVLQLIPHPERFAERFMYLPMLAPMLLLAGGLYRLEKSHPGWRQILVPILLVILALLTRSRLRDWEGPYPLWKSAVEAQPQCARAWFGLADAASEKGWNWEAVEGLRTTIEILGPMERDHLQQGLYLQALQIRAGLLATFLPQQALLDARSHWEELLEEVDTDGTAVSDQALPWFERMKVEVRLGDDEAALLCARRLLELESSLPEQRFESLMLLAALGSSEESLDSLEVARELAMEMGGNAPSRVFYQKGMLHLAAEEYELALKAFVESQNNLTADGRASSALYRQAECQLQLGRTQDAKSILENLLKVDPGHLAAHLSLGELLLATAERESARGHFEFVLSVSPDNPQAIQGMRQVMIRQRLEEGDSVALPDPTRIATLTLLAEKLQKEGQFEKAREALVEAEKEAEGPAERDRRLDLILRIARLDARMNEWDRAGIGYSRLFDRTEVADRGRFILEAVEVLRRTGGASIALEFLEQQQREGVSHPALRSQLGALADQVGDVEKALRWYREALENDAEISEQRRQQIDDRIKVLKKMGEVADPENNTVKTTP